MRNRSIVLMYHSIGDNAPQEAGAKLYCVPIERFREQMKAVDVLTRSRVNAPTRQRANASTILITFDDGDVTNYTAAYPVLKEFGLRAYFFILVERAGTAGYMNWEQIRELKEAGMIIGSHGMTHKILTELGEKELDFELKESKKILEDNVSMPVEYFSVPKGHYDKRVIERIKSAGYKGVFTSVPSDSDGFKFGRIALRSDCDFEHFKRIISGKTSMIDKLNASSKNVLKFILGAKRYDMLRGMILSNK